MEGYISHRAEREKEIIEKLTKNMMKAGLLVEAEAKNLCPVDTGRVRASITTKVEVSGSDVVGTVGTNVSYAPDLEFGTVNMPNHPFLYPALESKQSEIKDILKG